MAFPPNNPRSTCNHRRIEATEIVYRAHRGFVGTDSFDAEIITPSGSATRKHFEVEVR